MSYLVKNYNRKKISFKRGKGSYLFSTNGSKYLDFCSGIAVNSLGHANPKLIKAVNSQAKKLWHVSNAFQIPEGEKLAKKLCQKTFADYVVFQNEDLIKQIFPENLVTNLVLTKKQELKQFDKINSADKWKYYINSV